MKFLIDTNIFIPLEPTSSFDVELGTYTASEFLRLALETGHQIYIHPFTIVDINQDSNETRRKLREILFNKYPKLPDPPIIPESIKLIIGNPEQQTNDWIDHHLLTALAFDAIDYLVTEDQKIHKKALKLNIQERVVSVVDAISILQNLFDTSPQPPPAVKEIKAHNINENDPIFESFREDYPGFDEWLRKCKLDHRLTWIIEGHENHLAGITIIKPESGILDLPGKILKICSFKVSEKYNGFRYGELLLKTVFTYSKTNEYNWLYVTVFKKHAYLIKLFTDFGFESKGYTKLNELILVKSMSPSLEDYDKMSSLQFNIKYGPYVFKMENVPGFLVPIKPEYHNQLFPEIQKQLELIPGLFAHGNAIRKAYLSNARIRTVTNGANLFFYRSEDLRSIISLGIVENVLASSSAKDIAIFVGKRSVYKFLQIEEMCSTSQVLAILFRQTLNLRNPIHINDLISNKIINSAPQSIITLSEEAIHWLQQKIKQ